MKPCLLAKSINILRVNEHCGYPNGLLVDLKMVNPTSAVRYFRDGDPRPCFELNSTADESMLFTSYFIGNDWIAENQLAIQVQPKLDNNSSKTDFLKMLEIAMSHPDIHQHTTKLYEINFDQKPIPIEQKEDFLTPLLVIQFINILKAIVKKGLKKSYYTKRQNLSGKIKGKILVNDTIKKNHSKGQLFETNCQFEEFGINNPENQLLKKALEFCSRYLNGFKLKVAANDLNYVNVAFRDVNSSVNTKELSFMKPNPFYKEYAEGIRIAKLLLKRFGYNINNTNYSDQILTPPFWIDMSLLFELYVLGLLKDKFKNKVKYHFTSNRNELDFLLNSEKYKMVVDAKYKPYYRSKGLKIEDVRQLSGYARISNVYFELGKKYPEAIDCLIIYPNNEDGFESLENVDLFQTEVSKFEGFFKLGVKIPIQQQ